MVQVNLDTEKTVNEVSVLNHLWSTLEGDDEIQQIITVLEKETNISELSEVLQLKKKLDESTNSYHMEIVVKNFGLSQHFINLFYDAGELATKVSIIEKELVGFSESLDFVIQKLQDFQDTADALEALQTERIQLKGLLSNYINRVLVTPHFYDEINSAPLTPRYLDSLQLLRHKYIRASGSDVAEFPSARESLIELKALQCKAIGRIQKYFYEYLDSTSHSPDGLVIAQNTFLRDNMYLFHFLVQHYPKEANKIQMHYITVASGVYLLQFQQYFNKLEQRFSILPHLETHYIGRVNSLMEKTKLNTPVRLAIQTVLDRGLTSETRFAKNLIKEKRNDINEYLFSLGHRDEILHVAEKCHNNEEWNLAWINENIDRKYSEKCRHNE